MHRALAASLAAAALLVVLPAHAQPTFPAIIQDYLSAVRKPPCRVCHLNGQTGFGTVSTPFGRYMMSKGAKAFDEDGLRTALFALTLYGNHSDPDRKTPDDAEVLRRGGDPNDLNPVYLIEEPQYGCGGATFAARSNAAWPASLVIVLGLALARRRSPRSPR